MSSDVLFGTKAQQKLFKGIETLYKAVSTTLGPRGCNVAISKADEKGKIWERIILHDGVSVAKAIDPVDPYENLGASVVREAASKTVEIVGDATTVTIVLAHAIIKEALKEISMGINPMSLRAKLESDVDKLCKLLDEMAIPVKTLEQKEQVAIISAEDEPLGKLIAKTIHEIGDDGVLTVEESKNSDTTVERQEGMQLDKGYAHWAFVTDPQKMTATIEDCPVLVTDKPLTSMAEWGKFINEEVFPRSKKLVIISPEIGGDILEILLQNKVAGQFLSLAIPAPSFGDNQIQFLQDIAVLTGAKFVSKDTYKVEDLDYEVLGKIEKITASKNSTVIVSNENKQAVADRVEVLRDQLKSAESDFYAEKIKERLGKLTNGIAILRVGGQTEIEMKERKERALDAISAVKAACKEGIVPGGEIIYLRLQDEIDDGIIKRCLEKPFSKLVENAGMNSGRMLQKLEWLDNGFGIDVLDGEPKDMVKSGIIDPVLAPKTALKNALSVAVQILTTSCAIVPTEVK